ncbi:CXXC-20-CXXC protein [Alkalibacillus flavidus]|uniref:CXXC-20-CXXC protein n=1 Tax=Alkalibacillus flavidus TaxID=546021 RepID=A0ABV2KTR7_9BACI
MLTCASCGYQFSYKEALPFSWSTRVGRDCPSCGNRQFYSAESRKKSMYITVFSVIAIFVLNMLNTSAPVMFLVAGVLVVILLLLTPFIFDLSDEEQMW